MDVDSNPLDLGTAGTESSIVGFGAVAVSRGKGTGVGATTEVSATFTAGVNVIVGTAVEFSGLVIVGIAGLAAFECKQAYTSK